MMSRLILTLTAATLCGACASSMPVSRVRFEDRPIAWRVADDRDVPEAPEKSSFERAHNVFDSVVLQPIDRALAAEAKTRAKNVNAIGGVPNSSWYENRRLTPQEVFSGPGREVDAPSPPFLVKSAKRGGKSVGFIVEDARGLDFILKFDDPNYADMKSAANIVTQRLFYALGYHVPEDHVAYFERSDLRIGDDVEVTLDGAKKTLDEALLAKLLESVQRDPEGYRGLFSRFVEGQPLGGWLTHGTRDDDPNDVIDHEDRREIRGLHMFSAWLEHTDFKEDNRLDVYVTDEARGASYVKHYLVDFDKTLGVNAKMHPRVVDGFAVAIDPGYALATLPTFGLWARPWERIDPIPRIRGVGRFQSDQFDPDSWVPKYPETAFAARTRYDDFWAASVLANITPEHIDAAVRAARYTVPAAAEYVKSILLDRRRQLLEYGFSRVTPLDRFDVEARGDDTRFCFVDAWIEHRFDAPMTSRYAVALYTQDGRRLGAYDVRPDASGRACVVATDVEIDAYTIVKIEVSRHDEALEPVEVHLGRGPNGPRVVGVVREGD